MPKQRGRTDQRREARRYELRVEGHLDARWAAWFEGLSLTQMSDGTTVLHGTVADQPALHGLIQKLRDLGLPIVSVNQTDQPPRETT